MQSVVLAAIVAPVRFLPGADAAGDSNAQCSKCHLKDLCVPGELRGADVLSVDSLMFSRRRLKEGQPLYHEGDKFEFLYAVRSGTFKSLVSSKDGREQVTAFHMAGEMMGLDG